jgi:hypothetical protein
MKKRRRWLKDGSMDWRQVLTMWAYRNSSHDTISAFIFMGIIYKNDLRSVSCFVLMKLCKEKRFTEAKLFSLEA